MTMFKLVNAIGNLFLVLLMYGMAIYAVWVYDSPDNWRWFAVFLTCATVLSKEGGGQ